MRVLLVIAISSTLLRAGSLLDFSYGVLEEVRGNEKESGDFYEKAFGEDPTAMPLVLKIAMLRLRKDDRIGALTAWEQVLAKHSEDPALWIEYGDFIGRMGGGTAAEASQTEAFQKAIALAPGRYLPTQRLIVMAREKGDDERARELLETLNADTPESVNYYVASTRSLYDSRDEKAAARIDARFEQAISDHPEWPGIARSASDHFLNTGRLDKAIEILEKHVKASPSSLDLWIREGILLLAAGRGEEGLEILNQVIEIYPDKALAHESLAKYYRQHSREGEAREHTAELLKIRGGSSDEFLKLADELMEAGENRAARLLLEKAVFMNEDDSALMMKLAVATSRDPETKDSAGRLFREAEAMKDVDAPQDPAFQIAAAKQLIERGESKAAEAKLRDAIRSFPKSAKKETAAAMRALAGIWTTEGRNTDAARALISRAEALEK